MSLAVKHGIDQSVSCYPVSPDKSLIEYPGIELFVSLTDLWSQRGIVLHCKVEIEGVFVFCLQNPFPIKIVVGMLRIAVEPESGIGDGAAGNRLFHKRTWH